MTNPEIPEEAIQKAARLLFNAEWREGDWYWEQYPEPNRWQMLAGQTLAAALPHLRVQETPPWEGITSREPEGEALAQMRKWYADHDLPGPPPHPRPVVDREAIWRALYDVWQNPKELPIDFASEGTDAVLALLPTEEETKALAEVATKLGEAIGRKAAGEEIAARFLADARRFEDDRSNFTVAQHYARVARYVVSQPSDGPSEPLTAHTGHSDLPEGGEGL